MLYVLIVACEAAFWIALVLALAARYLLRKERLGRALLLALPAIDLLLLTALITWIDHEAATAPLQQWFRIAFGSVVLWFVFGPLWSVVFFRRRPQTVEN